MPKDGKTQVDPRKAVENMSTEEVLRAVGGRPQEVGEPDPVFVDQALSEDAPAQPPDVPVSTGTSIEERMMAMMAMMTNAIAALANKGGDDKAVVALTAAFDRMTAAQQQSANFAIEESRKAFRPSNQVIPNISVFNRRGDLLEDYKKPPLKCLMMIPWLVEWESCTREEVELLNLLEAGSYTIKRADRSKIAMEVVMEYKSDRVTPSLLTIRHESAFNNDNFKMMPPLPDLLRDMLKQHDRTIAMAAAMVLSDEEEEAAIESGDLSVSV